MTKQEVEELGIIHSEHHAEKWEFGCDCELCKKYEEYCNSIRSIVGARQELKDAH